MLIGYTTSILRNLYRRFTVLFCCSTEASFCIVFFWWSFMELIGQSCEAQKHIIGPDPLPYSPSLFPPAGVLQQTTILPSLEVSRLHSSRVSGQFCWHQKLLSRISKEQVAIDSGINKKYAFYVETEESFVGRNFTLVRRFSRSTESLEEMSSRYVVRRCDQQYHFTTSACWRLPIYLLRFLHSQQTV